MVIAPAFAAAPADIAAGYRATPAAVRAAVAKVLPSLCTIESYGAVPGAGRHGHGRVRGISRPGEGPTTGLIISPDGWIVTSTYNFVTEPPVITVVLRDGSQYVARLAGRDDTRMIALLKIDGVHDLPVPTFVPPGKLHVGQWAISVGVGYGGDTPALSLGIVSATGRVFGRAVQTDANISPANYGGPLLDIEGRVIGLCTPLSPYGSGFAGVDWYDSGVGFAVPLAGQDALVAALQAGKHIEPGRLGIAVQLLPPGQRGVRVVKVLPGSPAAAAGLMVKDIITTVDGRDVMDLMQLRNRLGRYVAGATIKLTIHRGDRTLTTAVTLVAGTDLPPPHQPVKMPGK